MLSSEAQEPRRQAPVLDQDYDVELTAMKLEWTEPGRGEPLLVNPGPHHPGEALLVNPGVR